MLIKPTDTLTWKKNDKYINRFIHATIYINKDTGQKEILMIQVDEIPPIKRKRKPKHKSHTFLLT